jgi:hypothetical protein
MDKYWLVVMTVNKITQELNEVLSADSDIDIIEYRESTSIISRIGSLVLGILSWIIIILFPIIVALEIIYICFPMIREAEDKLLLKIESSGVDINRIEVVYRDAKNAIKEAYCNDEVSSSTTSILWIYFKIKVRSVIFVFFILSFVIQGWSTIVDVVWSYVGNIVTAIFG